MKKLAVLSAFILAISAFPADAEQNFSHFRTGNINLNIAGSVVYSKALPDSVMIKYGKMWKDADFSSAKSINIVGYRLYKSERYEEAAEVFRAAITKDDSYRFSHYNLACTLALMYSHGIEIDRRELLYNLQCSVYLDYSYISKIKTDHDLDSIRSEQFFMLFMEMAEKGSFRIRDNTAYLTAGKEELYLASLIEENFGPRSITPQFQVSPDGKSAACVAYDDERAYLYVVTVYGFAVQITDTMLSGLEMIYECVPVWQPESKGILFAYNSELIYYDKSRLNKKVLLKLPASPGKDTIYEFGGYWFESANVIRFMGGSSLEFSFAGREYEILTDGSGLQAVPGGKVIEGEDLR